MNKNKYRFSRRGKLNYILAAIIVTAVFTAIYAYMHVMPFGTNSVLISDGFTQNYVFILEWYRKVHSGASLFYSWSFGLGTNFYVMWFTYLASPLNWLLMLLPEAMLELGICWLVVLKLALCAVSAVFYFMHAGCLKNFRYQKQLSCVLGVSYALSNGVLCYYFLFQWLDIYIFLPLAALALERLIETGSWKPYLILLFCTMLVNYVLAVPVCVFLALWFLLRTDWKCFKKRLPVFAGSSLLSALLCCFFLLPVICVLQNRGSSANVADLLTSIFSLMDSVLPYHTLDSDVMISSTDIFNVYCGTIAFFSAAFYMLFGGDSMKQRLKWILLYVFLVVSHCIPLLNKLWHGTVPVGFYNRIGFILVFVTLVMAAQGIKSSAKASPVRGICWLLVSVLWFVLVLIFAPELNIYMTYVVAMFVLAIMAMAMLLVQKKSIKQGAYIWLLVALSMAEVVTNALFALNQEGFFNWREYMDYASVESLAGESGVSEGRNAIDNAQNAFTNLSSLYGSQCSGLFSSALNEALQLLYQSLGLNMGNNQYGYNCSTPFTDLLFNVSTDIVVNPASYAASTVDEAGDWYLLESEYTAGYGFLFEAQDAAGALTFDDIFENQNAFFSALGGEGTLFTSLSLASLEADSLLAYYKQTDENTYQLIDYLVDTGEEELPDSYEEAVPYAGQHISMNGLLTLTYEFQEDMEDVYFYLEHSHVAEYLVALDEEPLSVLNVTVVGKNCMFHIPEAKKGQKLSIVISNNSDVCNERTIKIYAAAWNQDVFDAFYDQVSQSSLEVTSMTGTGMTGEVTAKEAGTLYTSVVDDGGFTVYVDGEKVEHQLLADCLICVPLTAGTHTVEFKYCPPGFKAGLIISLFALLLTVLLWNRKRLAERLDERFGRRPHDAGVD